jgi:hypothetical protein
LAEKIALGTALPPSAVKARGARAQPLTEGKKIPAV